MPHVPLFVSSKHQGKSKRGLYGDVIQELDWSVGEILKSLKKNGLDERTLVIFASDNGPWLLYGDHAGSAGPFREGKATTFEGGVRVPCIMRWPTQIPRDRTVRELAATIDILPTLATLAGAKLPADRIIDGRDIWPLIKMQAGRQDPTRSLFLLLGPAPPGCPQRPLEVTFSSQLHQAVARRRRREARRIRNERNRA